MKFVSVASETYHIIQAMKATGNRSGVIARWKETIADWAQMHRTDPNAAAVNAWLPLWQIRPFYAAEELAPMWPALAIATGYTNRWPAVLKSAARLEHELDFHGLPRLGCGPEFSDVPKRYRRYFIVERLHFWKKASVEEIEKEMENAQHR